MIFNLTTQTEGD